MGPPARQLARRLPRASHNGRPFPFRCGVASPRRLVSHLLDRGVVRLPLYEERVSVASYRPPDEVRTAKSAAKQGFRARRTDRTAGRLPDCYYARVRSSLIICAYSNSYSTVVQSVLEIIIGNKRQQNKALKTLSARTPKKSLMRTGRYGRVGRGGGPPEGHKVGHKAGPGAD